MGSAESALGHEFLSEIPETLDINKWLPEKLFRDGLCEAMRFGLEYRSWIFQSALENLSSSEKEIHRIWTGNCKNWTGHGHVAGSIANMGRLVGRRKTAIIEQIFERI